LHGESKHLSKKNSVDSWSKTYTILNKNIFCVPIWLNKERSGSKIIIGAQNIKNAPKLIEHKN
jgi:hypothetical protein